MFKFQLVEVLATECMEGPRNIIETVHTKLTRATTNKTVQVPNCCYKFLWMKTIKLVAYEQIPLLFIYLYQ